MFVILISDQQAKGELALTNPASLSISVSKAARWGTQGRVCEPGYVSASMCVSACRGTEGHVRVWGQLWGVLTSTQGAWEM